MSQPNSNNTSPWRKERIGIRFNKKMDQLLTEEFIEYLQEQYGGPTPFFEEALRREKKQKPSLDERIEELDQDISEKKEKKKALLRKKKQRKKKDELDKKKNKLRDLQAEVNRLSHEGLTTREEAEQKVLETYRNRSSYSDMTDEEIKQEIAFERQVNKKVTDNEQVKNLVEEVESLQEEIKELSDQSYDWFINPRDKLEVSEQ